MSDRIIHMEEKTVEEPRVPYSEIFDRIDGHRGLSTEQRLEVRAIDIMVDALLEEQGVIDRYFGGYTLGDKSRLTDQRDPNYGEDLLMSVHTPAEFLEKVTSNASEEARDKGILVRWRERMSEIANPRPRDHDVPDQAKAKKIVRDLLARPESELSIAVGAF